MQMSKPFATVEKKSGQKSDDAKSKHLPRSPRSLTENVADVLELMTKFNEADIPEEGRYLMLDAK
ncbi:hypothetical protein EVA_18569, partial [gut metagenome]